MKPMRNESIYAALRGTGKEKKINSRNATLGNYAAFRIDSPARQHRRNYFLLAGFNRRRTNGKGLAVERLRQRRGEELKMTF